mgnify:CR=1 FL=1
MLDSNDHQLYTDLLKYFIQSHVYLTLCTRHNLSNSSFLKQSSKNTASFYSLKMVPLAGNVQGILLTLRPQY